MITTAQETTNSHGIAVSIATQAGHRISGGKVIRGQADSTTVCRRPIIETPEGMLPDDCDTDQARDVLGGMVLSESLISDEIDAILSLYPAWGSIPEEEEIPVDKLVTYDGTLYKTLQKHPKLYTWTPAAAVSLFAKVVPKGIIEPWEQRGSTNPYMIGDKVSFEGHIWESTINNNTWSPSVLPSGWADLGAI